MYVGVMPAVPERVSTLMHPEHGSYENTTELMLAFV